MLPKIVLFMTLLAINSVAMVLMGCGRRHPAKQAGVEHPVAVAPRVVPSQATPVRNWLHACKAGDVALLRTVFSRRLDEVMEDVGWDVILRTYRELWWLSLGEDYDVDDLSFEYVGDERWGHVLVDHVFGSPALPPIRVVYEDGAWRVFEDAFGAIDG